MGKPNTTALDVINKIFKNTSLPFDAIGNLYLSLHTGLPSGSDQTSNETNYGSYQRYAVSRDAAGWTTATNNATNSALISFIKATSGPSTITYLGIGTSANGVGQLLYSGPLTSPLIVNTNVIPTFNATSIVVTEA